MFISWSGDRSQKLAEALRKWISDVVPGTQPWLSAQDVASGVVWTQDLLTQLKKSRVGIICLTKENYTEPWILFESGALLKYLPGTFVCPYLLDLEPEDLKGPLSLFQAARADEDGTNRLVHSINKACGKEARDEAVLNRHFEVWWPRLEPILSAIRGAPRGTHEELLEYKIASLHSIIRDLLGQLETMSQLLDQKRG